MFQIFHAMRLAYKNAEKSGDFSFLGRENLEQNCTCEWQSKRLRKSKFELKNNVVEAIAIVLVLVMVVVVVLLC